MNDSTTTNQMLQMLRNRPDWLLPFMAVSLALLAVAHDARAQATPSHHWPGEGNTADAIGGVNGSIVVGKVGYAAGPVGKAFQFDGTSWVSIPRAAAVVGKADFSVKVWIQTISTAPAGIVQQRSESDYNGEWLLALSEATDITAKPGAVCYWDYNKSQGGTGLTMCTPNSLADGKPHHIVFIRSGTTGRIFVDGELAVSQSKNYATDLRSLDLSIGGDRRDRGRYFKGLIDEVKIYPSALPDSDGDNILDLRDICPSTPPRTPVNPNGCSIPQLVPCSGPLGGGTWTNKGQYISTLAQTARGFLDLKRITQTEKDAIMSAAARSNCGGK